MFGVLCQALYYCNNDYDNNHIHKKKTFYILHIDYIDIRMGFVF